MAARIRETIDFDAEVHRALERRAAESGRDLSDLVNETVERSLAPGAGSAGRSAEDAAPRFELRLLGHPLIRRVDPGGERRELIWRLRRSFQSVAFLALAPDRRAAKEELVDAVWRDVGARSIARNFHPALSEARRTLGHPRAILFRQGMYSLDPGSTWRIDSERFVELRERGRRLLAREEPEPEAAAEAWAEAWSLYRGPLLAGVDADWIRPQRAALYRDYIELLRGLGGLCARLGRITQALDAYRSVLLEEPYEERIHLSVMELYARQGRRDLVRRQFVRLQELLLDELNVEPLDQTQERYHELMR